ncbi:MAG TPA: 7-cyano-7-deazaguanine synthase QueC [Acidimicrobiales bacterium]|nr:7-cyano-7-deazaguanine synthase QueC [Acidimicrobiales bacterium]
MTGHLVLLSGGLDSTVCLAVTAGGAHPCEPLVTLAFDYGQRHRVELDHAAEVSHHFGADHLVVALDTSAWGGSALTDSGVEVPEAGSGGGIPVTYVPARNLIFLSVAMGVAEARDLLDVTIGVNSLDYSGYPDCRPEFIASFRATATLALKRGTEGRPVEVLTPLIDLSKRDIVSLGLSLEAPLELTWSCYRGGDRPCGTCDSCALRARGFAAAGVRDPALGWR